MALTPGGGPRPAAYSCGELRSAPVRDTIAQLAHRIDERSPAEGTGGPA